MHMSLPEKFPPSLAVRRAPIGRLRSIITAIAGIFFTIVFFLAVKIYIPSPSNALLTDRPLPNVAFTAPSSTSSPIPPPAENSLEPTDEDNSNIASLTLFTPPDPQRYFKLDSDGLIPTGIKNISQWYSVGRSPSRKQCWSYKSRFSRYISPPPEILDLISTNNKPTNNRAIVVRLAIGHPWKTQFNLHARALVLEAGFLGMYDVVFLVHGDQSSSGRKKWLDKNVPREFRPLVQFFSTAELKTFLNRTAPFKSVMDNNHLPLQMFVTHNKQYDFIYSIESDVRLIGRWDEFLADVDSEYKSHRERQGEDQDMPETPDLVAFEALRRPSNNWLWLDDKCIKDFGGHEDLRMAIGPMWGWSRRLIEKLNAWNDNGVNCYYEYFAPTIAYKENLTTFFYQHPLYCPRKTPSGRSSLKLEELGKNDPRTVKYHMVARGCTYFFVNPHSQPFWEEWYKARNDPKACWPPALVHPVKGDFYN